MSEKYFAVIMAGGGGTRLWPLSRRKKPKQMLALIEARTLFQIAVERLADLFPPERILVVTTKEQAQELQAQTLLIPGDNFLLEPAPRGTASAIGLAAAVLQNRQKGATMAVLTADHYIGNESKFLEMLRAAEETAQKGFLVTLGIEPTSPSSAYGYIQQGEELGTFGGKKAFRAARFKEKPSPEQAQEMLAAGGNAWNSGMFIWQVETIMSEFGRQMPELKAALDQIGAAWDGNEREQVLAKLWPALKPETIDYGIMENAEKVAVIPASGLQWNDVGSWNALFDVLETDEAGNVALGGEQLNMGTSSTLVHSDADGRMVVTIGVEDLVIVDTEDVLLVCAKDQAEKVRQAIQKISE
ncbi:MAG: sugar phosphate nucleotidyltransferase, partial [Anaerolineae bacterium]|nr:sugar phosphate nucleotidyltransferase [Anaerolineae bacterium]